MYKIKNQKGFVGLLVLLIATAIIGYLSYSALIQEGDNPNTEGFKQQIEKAEEIARIAEDRAKKINKEMGEFIDKNFPESEIDVALKINTGEDSYKYSKKAEEGISVFDLMKKISEEEGFSFKYQESDLGAFVEEIKGVKNDTSSNMYWMFYINDKMAEVGASQYVLKDNDTVEWKYEDASDLW